MLSPQAYFDVLKATLAHTSKTTPDDVATLQNQYSRQLWHEFSTGLLHALAHDPLVRLASYDIHEVLVVPVRANLDGSVYVRLLFHACTALVSDDGGSGDKLTSLLDSAMASLSTNGHEQCVNAVHCLKALVLMAHGPSLEAKALIDKVTDYVTTVAVHELLPVLQAFLHRARLRQAELLCNYTDFYGNAFAVARYGAAAGIPLVEEELSAVAYKAATAALLAPDVYNFGDFLTNASFVAALDSSPNQWALELLRLCSNGVVERFDRFMAENGASLASDLQQAVRSGQLGKKVRLMALLHLIFITPAHERTIPFSTIAQKCSVSEDEVERVVLAAMAQRLVEGSIDEVAQTVQVTWSQPRVMDLAEIGALADSIASWRKAVREAADQVGKLAANINK